MELELDEYISTKIQNGSIKEKHYDFYRKKLVGLLNNPTTEYSNQEIKGAINVLDNKFGKER
jgi:hypothetical protein